MDPFAELGCLAATTLSSPGGNGNGGASPTGWVSGNPQGGGMGSGNGGGGMGGLGGLGIGGCGMGGAGSCGIGGMTAASPQEQVVPAAKSAGQHYEGYQTGYQPQSLEQPPHGYPPQGLFVEQPGDDANGSGSSMPLASDLASERRTEMAGGEPSPLRSTPPQKLEPRPQQQLAPDATLAFAALAQGRPCLPRQAQLARPSSISSAELPLSRCRGFSL